MRQIVLDTETTGLDPKFGHRLVEIGCIELKNRRPTGRTFQTYINPERDMDPGATAISGITTAFLKDKPKFIEVVDAFIEFIQEGELIIHNAPFDLGFLNHELFLLNPTYGKLEDKFGFIDTLAMARKMHPGQKNNLDALCKRYNVDNSGREFHGALLDADLLVRVYLAMTAGQSRLGLGEEEDTQSFETGAVKTKLRAKAVRRGTEALRVIRANEEEVLAHDLRMKEIVK